MESFFFTALVYFLNFQTFLCLEGSDDDLPATKETINDILARLKSAEKQIQELQQAKYGNHNTADDSLVERNNEKSKRYLTNGNTAVGFTACLSTSGDVFHQGDQTIIFDKVFTNVGQGYNSHTGIFTAPRRGLYVFHLAAMSRAGTSKYLDLVKDGNELDKAYVGAHGVIDYQSVAKEWALELNQGSQVWIKDGTYKGDVIDGWCKTAFTGYMVATM